MSHNLFFENWNDVQTTIGADIKSARLIIATNILTVQGHEKLH